MGKRVLLLGAGPTHLTLLQALAHQPLAGAEVALVAPFAHQIHTPLLPALVAGHCSVDQCSVALPPLAAAGRVHFIEAFVLALDATARQARLSDGRVVDFDLLSLDPGPATDRDRTPGARELGLFLRPAEHFVRLLDGLWDLAARRVLDVVVVGGGLDAVALALALAQRLNAQDEERARVALVTGLGFPADGSAALVRRVLRALAAQRVTVFRDSCRALLPGAVVLASGAHLACDAPVLATAGEPPAWLQPSGLALDAQGWVDTGATLQSRSHPDVLAAGEGAENLGHLLTANLRAMVGAGPLQNLRMARPLTRFVDLGQRHALLSRGGWVWQGRWAWWYGQRALQRQLARCRVPATGL